MLSSELKTNLHNMQFRQQVAVSQSQRLAVQEGAGRGNNIIGAILINLLRKWAAQVVVQFLQRLQEALFKIWAHRWRKKWPLMYVWHFCSQNHRDNDDKVAGLTCDLEWGYKLLWRSYYKYFSRKESTKCKDCKTSQTFIGLGVWVLDVGGEFGEDVHACSVGLWVPSGQTYISEKQEENY